MADLEKPLTASTEEEKNRDEGPTQQQGEDAVNPSSSSDKKPPTPERKSTPEPQRERKKSEVKVNNTSITDIGGGKLGGGSFGDSFAASMSNSSFGRSFRIRKVEIPDEHELRHGPHGHVYVSNLVALSILARGIEPTRFTMPSKFHDQEVTKELYDEVITAHHDFMIKHRDLIKANQEITDPESPLYPHRILRGTARKLRAASMMASNHDLPKMLKDSERIWSYVHPEDIAGVTFTDLLKYDQPDYPVTTPEQRTKLYTLTSQTTVRRRDVLHALDIEVDHPIIDLVFGGSRTVPGQALEQICQAMELHPKRLPFLSQCAQDIVSGQRNMASFFLFFMVFIATLILIPKMEVKDMFTAKRTIWWPTTDDWLNYCKNGTTEPCHMIKRNLPDMHTLYDAETYWHEEMVSQLWGWPTMNGSSAANQMFGGHWLIGGMLLRMSPMTGRTNESVPVTTCAELNLTVEFTEYLMPQSFRCSAWSHILIPFSDTKEQALAKARQFRAEIPEPNSDSLAVIQFGAMRPGDGTLVWTTMTATIPNGGNIISRSTVIPVHLTTKSRILPFMVMQCCLLFFNIVLQFYYSSRQFSDYQIIAQTALTQFSLIPPLIQTGLIVGAYFFADNVNITGLAQAEYMIEGLDKLASDNATALDLMAAWVFLFFGLSVRYLKDVVSVGLVIRLLKVALAEVIGLLVIFGFTYIMFVMSSMVLLGSTEVNYSSFFRANSMLLPYFWGDADYVSLITESPFLGGAFFFVYQIFVVFFALNLLIAVVTAPLGEVREAANLHLELYEMLIRPMSKAPMKTRADFSLRKLLLPIVSILTDCLAFLPVTDKWVTFNVLAHKLYYYDPADIKTLRTALNAGADLMKFCSAAHKIRHDHPWDTTLLQGSDEFECIPDDVSREFLHLANCYSSTNSWARDGRLLRILISFDMMNTVSEKIVTESAELREQNAEKENEIVAMQDSEAKTLEINVRPRRKEVKSVIKKKVNEKFTSMRSAFNNKNPNLLKTSELNFAFSQYLNRKLASRRFFPIYFIAVLIGYILFVTPILSSKQGIAWLNENVHGGIRDFPYVTNCADTQCTGGFMHTKDMTDTGPLGDIYQFFDSILAARVFPDHVPYYNESTADAVESGEYLVYWDRYLRRVGPVQMRQIRGAPVTCTFPGDLTGDPARAKLMRNTTCYGDNSELYTGSMAPPKNWNYNLLSAEAFDYQETCVEVGGRSVTGWLADYPCAGYIVNITTKQELEMVRDNWINGEIRFLVITLNFRLDVIKFQYNIYMEYTTGGGTGFVWTRSAPQVDQTLGARNWIAYILLGWEMAVWIYVTIRYNYFLSWSGDLLKAEQVEPEFPTSAVLTTIAGAICLVSLQELDFLRESLYTVLAAQYLTVKFLLIVVFPTAELFTRRASTVLRVLTLTTKTAVIVIPFYFVYAIAFSYYGHLVFGQTNLSFATLTQAFLTVGRGIVGVWDTSDLYEEKPVGTLVLNFLFFVIVLTILANLILSLITGAADEARAEMATMDYIANCTEFLHYPLYSGPLFECWLYWAIHSDLVKRFSAPQRFPFVITKLGRFGLPSEQLSWLPFLGCTLTSEVLDMLDFKKLPMRVVTSTVMLVAKEVRMFETYHRERSLDDEALERVMRLRVDAGDDDDEVELQQTLKLQPTVTFSPDTKTE